MHWHRAAHTYIIDTTGAKRLMGEHDTLLVLAASHDATAARHALDS